MSVKARNIGSAIFATLFILALSLNVDAATDLGDGKCYDEGAQAEGAWNGSTADDAGCITKAEYEAKFSLTSLEEAGVFVVNGDGTVTFPSGVVGEIIANPLDRPVAATPSLEPDAPTVAEWFGWDKVHAVTGGGPQA